MPLQDAAEKLLLKVFNEGIGNVESVNSGTAVTISDPAVFSITNLTLNGATPVITLPTPRAGAKKVILLTQDGTGSRIPSWVTPAGAVKWSGAAAPTLSTAAGRIDRITMECLDGTNWFGVGSINYG